MTAVARGQRAIIRLMQDDPEASYSADDLGGEGAALTGLVIAGKITKSGRGSAARYMLAEDVAVGEQPDEVVPVPPEEEEERRSRCPGTQRRGGGQDVGFAASNGLPGGRLGVRPHAAGRPVMVRRGLTGACPGFMNKPGRF